MPDQQTQPEQSGAGAEQPVPAVTIQIVLADDHAVVRSGLRLLLDGESDFEVVAEAGDLDSARRYVRGHTPDVLVLDLNMPGGSSLEAIPDDPRGVAADADRGADDAAGAGVRTSRAWRGRDRICAQGGSRRRARGGGQAGGGRRELSEPAARRADGLRACSPDHPTTSHERELEVLRLIALGHTNAEIAEQLYLSVRTVETHRAHIQQKLSLSSRAELVGYALRRGLVNT